LDAGHGGEDPGSIGPSRVYEKNVALDISKRLQKLLEKQPGYRVEMTRTGDYGLDLDQRRKIARQKRADLFVSIHADAFKKRDVRGASVYAWNKDGNMSKNEIDLYLQQREKESDLIGGFGDISIKDRDVIVAQTLMDLSITYSLSSSLEAGADILKEMSKITKLHGNPMVRQAQFVVLRTPDVPSLLVETGFISNPTDERLLNSAKYQQEMAQSIFGGVTNYFSRMPPEGSYLAWVKNSGRGVSEHVISRGESLSLIANRYKVSIADLKNINGLSNDKIRVGQTLKIPAT
jgi:N-acetylmuramoyl-L-alanine amidase